MKTVINFHVSEGNLMVAEELLLSQGIICFLLHRKHMPHCGDQSVSSVQRNNRCLLWEPYETHKYTLLALRTVYSVKADGTCDNYCFKGVDTPHRIFLCKNLYNIKTVIIKTKMGSAAWSLGASDLEDSTDAFLLVTYRLPRPLNYRHLVRLRKCKKCNHLNAVPEVIKASLTEKRYGIKLCCFIPCIWITFH